MKNLRQRGITFLEIMIVIAILGIITAIAIPQFSQMKKFQVLKNVSEDVISSINKAKSQTLSSLDSSSYGVRFQTDSLIIFKGVSFDFNNPDNEVIEIDPIAEISNINLSGGEVDFYFERLSGIPSNHGSITVSIISDPSLSKNIILLPTGMANLN